MIYNELLNELQDLSEIWSNAKFKRTYDETDYDVGIQIGVQRYGDELDDLL